MAAERIWRRIAAGARRPHIAAMPDNEIARFDADKLRADEALVEERFWDKVRKTLGRVPFV